MKNLLSLDPAYKVIMGLLLVLCILFYPVIFQGKTFGSPDSLGPKAGTAILKKVAAESNEYPLWQPWIFSGMPTAEAFTNIGKLYFPGWLFKPFLFISNLGLYIQLLHLLFAGIGGYMLLRTLNVSHIASFFAGAAFMCTPYMILMIVYGHGSQMMTAAYIPWIMWMTIRIMSKPSLRNIGLLAILMGFQLQRAHAQIAYYTWMLAGAYVLYTLIINFKNPEKRNSSLIGMGSFASAAILGISIALLIYLPSIEYTPFSVRGGGASGGADYNYATSWSFHPKEMLTFFIPSAFGFGGQTYWGHMPFTDYPNYMGIVVLTLAIFGLTFRWNQLTKFLLGSSILALFISFGSFFSPVYNLFYNYLPFFNKFRVPSMILILLQFNVAVLAAFGLDSIISFREKEIPKWLIPTAGVLAVIALILMFGESSLKTMLYSSFTPPRTQDPRTIQTINSLRWDMWYKDAWLMLLFFGAVIGLIWLWIKRSVSREIVLGSIVALAVIDIGLVDYKIIQPDAKSGRSTPLISKRAIDRHFQPDDVIRFLLQDQETPFRIYPAGLLFGESRFRAFGIESVGGYHPAKLDVYNQFLENTRNLSTLPLMRMLNVRYMISPQVIEHPEITSVFTGRLKTGRGELNVTVYRIQNELPRAWFVEKVKIISNPELIWNSISNNDFDPTMEAYVTDPIAFPDTLSTGKILSLETSIHKVSVRTESKGQGFLVVSEVYYPLRWQASIDGKPVGTIKTNGVLRGISVPAGDHLIEFEYDRSSFRMGIGISVIAFLITLGCVGYGFYRDRRQDE